MGEGAFAQDPSEVLPSKDQRDIHPDKACCSICGRVLVGTKWFCTQCYREYQLDDTPWTPWVRFVKNSEAKRRRDMKHLWRLVPLENDDIGQTGNGRANERSIAP